jgi:hypothetical protein
MGGACTMVKLFQGFPVTHTADLKQLPLSNRDWWIMQILLAMLGVTEMAMYNG